MFDFDNTLVNSLYCWNKVIDKEMFKKHNLKPDKRMNKQRTGKSNRETAEMFISTTKLDLSPEMVISQWNAYMQYFYLNKIKLIKGAKEYLISLKQKQKTLVLASATDENLLRIALKHFDIDIFDYVFTESNLNLPKHSPKFYKECLVKLNTSAKKVFLFEDSFPAIKSASSINIECCALVNRLNKNHKEDFKKLCKATIKNYKSKKLLSFGL